MSISKTAVVTGGSSGIGRSIALQLANMGYHVFDLSRSGLSHNGIKHIECDITDIHAVSAAFNEIISSGQRIDLLINNAGMGISGAVEFTDEMDARRIFDVNFFGAFYVIQAVTPIMRKQKSGRIINICSVAADIPIPFQAFYSAGKAALCSLSMALRSELRPFGISVAAVLPGDVKTGFTEARKKDHKGDDIYQGRISRSVSRMEKDEQNGIECEKAAAKIVSFAHRRQLKPKYTVGMQYKVFAFLIKVLPASLVTRIVYLMYAK